MMSTSVHRLLDEAFAGIPGTPDAQDLKEEIRANLLDRVAELTAGGVAPDKAARRAVDELGDVRALVEEASGPTAGAGSRTPASPGVATSAAAAAAARQRVPVRRRYVVGVIVASVVVLLALVPLVRVVLLVADRLEVDGYLPLVLAWVLLIGPAVGWIVAASLLRETATNYGMPRWRAVSYGVAAALVLTSLVAGVESYLLFESFSVPLQVAVPLLVAGGAWLAYLLATQTNRHKPWVLELARQHAQVGNRFEEDPAAAARFGIYTMVLWALTGVAFLAVGFTAGWQWALLPALLGVAAFMLLLARMLFGAAQGNDRPVP
jgi:hypothetical protein